MSTEQDSFFPAVRADDRADQALSSVPLCACGHQLPVRMPPRLFREKAPTG